MKCDFCDILAGKSQAYIVFEDVFSLAFLDTKPLFPGHVLLIPKEHTNTLVELETELIEPLFMNAQILAGAVQVAMESQGSFVAINNTVSQSVPHLHIHIVPRNKKDGLKGFFWPRTPYENDAHIEEVRARISEVVGSLPV